MASEHRIMSELHYAAGRLASLLCDAEDGTIYEDHEHSEWMLCLVLAGLDRVGLDVATLLEVQRGKS